MAKTKEKLPKAECGNCGDKSTDYIPLDETPGLQQRLDPGSEVPAGECKKCGALTYEVTK